jgi:hypothetical protein
MAAFLAAVFRLVVPSFLACAAMTLISFFVLFRVLTKLFFCMNKLLEVWIGGPGVICRNSRLGTMLHRSPLGELQVTRVGNDAEAVLLQFENVIRVIKWLFDEPQAHGANSWQHGSRSCRSIVNEQGLR